MFMTARIIRREKIIIKITIRRRLNY